MLGYTTLKQIVGKDIALSGSMIEAINSWKKMINRQAEWITDDVKSLQIENGICREFTDCVLVEMETAVDDERLNAVYQKCIGKLNENLQEGLALGSMIIRPLGGDKVEFVTADKFVPISFDDDGKPIDVGFFTIKRVGETDIYTRFERHYLREGNLTIETKCYHSQSKEQIGIPCSLGEVAEWADISPGPTTFVGMDKMDFGYYRNPLKNKVDGSACGVSIFDNATELIEKADKQGARLDWEYESGERVVHVDSRALRGERNGRFSMPTGKRRLYRGLNLDAGKDKELLHEYSPDIRDDSYTAGLENYFRRIEFAVGLAYGDLSDAREVDKTATEIKASKARKYNRVTAIQACLEECLRDFAEALAFYQGSYTAGREFTCKFNDSILTDEETERTQDRLDVSMGVLSLWEYRMKWYNEDEETAKASIPQQADIME